MSMPSMREELLLLNGTPSRDGQPSWTIHDPVRNQFFKIDWQSFEILKRWHFPDPQAIVDDIERQTTLQLSTEDIDEVYRFMRINDLLRSQGAEQLQAMNTRYRQMKGDFAHWLLHNYLFFRVPLVKPDAWLSATVKRVDFFYSAWFMRLSMLALVFGLFEVMRQWDAYYSSLVDMVSMQGLMSYAIALGFVKILHELGHAYTAKRYACRIPSMGIAFLVLWPVAYTDTNDVWKLTKRQQRLAVASAGIIVELTIAVWATVAWVLLPDGHLKSIAFILSSTTWISSLLINVSPFMRFDGYFLLADFLELPNLHQRAFAIARWNLRECLFGVGEPAPEVFSKHFRRFLTVFAYFTWVYRLALFLGIAALVYTFFIKIVGIFLFAVEIVWFVLMPIWRELHIWKLNWLRYKNTSRTRRSVMWFFMFLLLLGMPWPTKITSTALIKPSRNLHIYSPASAQLIEFPWRDGDMVKQGDLVLRLHSPELMVRYQKAKSRYEQSQWQSETTGVDGAQRANLQLIQQQMELAKAELNQVENDLKLFEFRAPFTGVIKLADPDLQIGSWMGPREKVVSLVGDGVYSVETFLDEDQVRRIQTGDQALFVFDGAPDKTRHFVVASIDKDATHVLTNGLYALPAGGNVVVREKRGQLIPERAVYRVVLTGTEPVTDSQILRGQIVINGEWESPALKYARTAVAVFWRELGM